MKPQETTPRVKDAMMTQPPNTQPQTQTSSPDDIPPSSKNSV